MRGVVLALVFLLIVSSVSAWNVIENGYEGTAKYHSPILFIPGVMGSILEDNNRWTIADELWPGNPQESRLELAYTDNGRTPLIEGSDIEATSVLWSAWGSPIYIGFYEGMESNGYMHNGFTDDGFMYQRHGFYSHPYDFRKPTEEHISVLNDKVDEVLKMTKSDKIILVAHSMGGLQARMYAAKYPKKVRALILLSSPLNGAPRGFESLTEGYNFGAGPLISIPHVWEIGHNWPGIYHLTPTHKFAKLNGRELEIDETFFDGINYQQAEHIPASVFHDLAARGITDPAAVTAELSKEYEGLSKTIVKQKNNFRKRFAKTKVDSDVRVEIIHGDGQFTTQSFIVKDELYTSTHLYKSGETQTGRGTFDKYSPFQFTVRRYEQVNSNEGDETVHKKGFTWDRAEKVQSVQSGHMAMAGIPETIGKVMEIVEELNHDKRDKRWLDRISALAAQELSSVSARSPTAESQSERYGEAYKNEIEKEERNENFISRLLGDIKGRGKFAFFAKLIEGKQNNVQIVVKDIGQYDDKNKHFKAWIVLDSYTIVETNIGTVAPIDYVVSTDAATFMAIVDGKMSLRDAWKAGKINVSGGIKQRLMGWIGKWVTKYTS